VIKPEEWAGTNKSVADVVAEQTGVQTRRYGGTGSFQTVSIRGVQGSEVLVLLDGIPLNSAMGGAVDLGKINISHLGEIEVYKGITPGVFGGNSIGGVVNLKTRKAVKSNTGDASVTFGSYGLQKCNVILGPDLGNAFSVNGGVSLERSKNDYPYLDRNNTIYGTLIDPKLDDTIRTVKNDQYKGNKKHIAALEGKENATAYDKKQYYNASLSFIDDEDGKTVYLTPLVSYRAERSKTVATRSDQSFGSSHGGNINYFEYRYFEQKITGSLYISYTPFEWITISPCVIVNLQDGTPEAVRDNASYGNWHSREASGTFATDANIRMGKLSIKGGISVKGIYSKTEGGIDGFSRYLVPESDTITSLLGGNAGISFQPTETFLLYVNGGHFSNNPALSERYGARGAQMPNPLLKPETGNSFESGLKLNLSDFFIDAAFFSNRTKNTIVMIKDGYMTKPSNCAGARIFGVELMSTLEISKMLGLEIRATWQNSKNLTIENGWYGRRLPDQPDLTLRGGVDFHPIKKMSLRYSASFTSFYYHLPATEDDSRVPAIVDGNKSAYGRLTHDISLTWTITKWLKVTGSGNELTSTILPMYPPTNDEAGYSWTLYPANQWCICADVSF
jgi:iron complex outermembrane receptor protein